MNEQSETPTPAHGTQVKSPVKSETRRMPMFRIFVASVILLLLAVLLWHPWNQTSTATATPDAGAQSAPLTGPQMVQTAAALNRAATAAAPTASPTSAPCGNTCTAVPPTTTPVAPVSGNAQAAAPVAILSSCSVQGVEKVDFYLNPGDLNPIPNSSIYAGSVDASTIITVTGEQNGWVRVNAANLAIVDVNGVTTGHLNAGGWVRPNTGLVCGGTSQEANPTQESMVAPGATPTLFVPGS